MSAAELAPIIETLPQNEKIEMGQSFSEELYPMWTPYNTPAETASTLANMLASEADDN